MDISLRWLNRYLDPAGVTADEADALLTGAGLPIESRTQRGEDTVLDVEVTSNRGDCLSHVGCAREVAAASRARRLVLPEIHDPAPGRPNGAELTLENLAPAACPRFTARLIRGVTVGPSPAWLVEALESVGARSINNVVDVTNFVTFELGNPCHVFDHAKLAGGALVVRHARKGERIKTLYEGEHELIESDVVVADAQRPQSLAGVIGGFDSQVDAATTTVAFEMATWAPAVVRGMGRRMGIRTDAAYRFERRIDPRTIDLAARRAVALICELSGGQVAEGVLDEGPPLPAAAPVRLRPSRAALVLGVETPAARIVELLRPLGIECRAGGDALECTIPPHRAADLTREADLVEEVARMRGLGEVPVRETLPVRVRAPQGQELAQREIAAVLTGLGAFETVTFVFTSPARAGLFCPHGVGLVGVDDDRRKAEPTLRPSLMPGLLECRRANRDAGVSVPGGLRLFETAAVFGERTGGVSAERRVLGLLMDVPGEGKARTPEQRQQGVRLMRGAIDAVVRACAGTEAAVVAEPARPPQGGWDGAAFATLRVRAGGRDEPLGHFGLIGAAAMREFDLDAPVVGAELDLDLLTGMYPPRALASELPRFPGIERDLSLIVDDAVAWSRVAGLVEGLRLERLTGHALVGVYRGERIGRGRKSVTVRLAFRDPDRTLRREEVDPQVERLTAAAARDLGAEVRA